MRILLIILFNILSVTCLAQYCNTSTAIFPGFRGSFNAVTYVRNTVNSNNTQTWIYAVKAGRPEPSFIFFHNPCVNIIEAGIVRNKTLVKRQIVDHTYNEDPLTNQLGWKLEFYSDTIYIITNGIYDVKPIDLSMKYSTFLNKDTICGPDCSLLNIKAVQLINPYLHAVILVDSNSNDTYELQYSRDGIDWNTHSFIVANNLYMLSGIRPGVWYAKARNSYLESNILLITVNPWYEIQSIDELGRKVVNDQRSLKPAWKFD